MSDQLSTYILNHIEPEPEYLYRLWRATNIHTIHGRMASGHLQGRLLKMLVQMIRPTNVLEVGTFSGYSAICLAEGLEDNGKVWTFEINDEMEDFTRLWIENSPVAHRIHFIIGMPLPRLPSWVSCLIWLSSTGTSALTSRLTKWHSRSCERVVSSLPTTLFGMVTL